MARRRKLGRLLLGTVATILILVIAVPAGLVLVPRSDDPVHSDVIMTVGPPFDARLALADRMMRAGMADQLVVATYDDQHERDTVAMCNEPQPYRVHCFTPEPYTTQGEAQAMARMAEENGWRSVQVITFAPHVNRVRALMNRCYSGKLRVVQSRDYYGPYETLHHMGGWLKMLTYWEC